jgi:O-antigen/teichoic acid export membrane protein
LTAQTASAQLTEDDRAPVGPSPGLAARGRGALVAWIGADPQTLVSGLDAIKVLLIRCIGAVIACALQVVMARLLGAVEYGMFALVWIWVIMLAQISPLGFSTLICRFAPHYAAREETALLRGFLSTTSVVVFALATAVMILGIIGLWTLGSGLSEAERWAFTAGLCLVPIMAMQDVVENIARAFNWPVLAIAPGYIVRPVLTLIGLFALAAAGWEVNAFAAVVVTLAAAFAGAVGQTAILLSRVRRAVRPGERIRRFGEWAKSALPLIFVDGTHIILASADILI